MGWGAHSREAISGCSSGSDIGGRPPTLQIANSWHCSRQHRRTAVRLHRVRQNGKSSLTANKVLASLATMTYIQVTWNYGRKSHHTLSRRCRLEEGKPSTAWLRRPPLTPRPAAGRSETRPTTVGSQALWIKSPRSVSLLAMTSFRNQAGEQQRVRNMKPDKSKSWRRRLKSRRKWPRSLRNPCLLRWAIFVGVALYRLWRFWRTLTGMPDG